MPRPTNWIRVRNLVVPAVAAASMAFAQVANAAGVMINMPAPPKRAPVAVEGAPKSAAANAMPAERVDSPKPDVGQIALHRYANARTEPYDTYDFGMPYYRNNYYNYGYYGYPWFWGFPVFGFGFGFVGCHTPCAAPCHR